MTSGELVRETTLLSQVKAIGARLKRYPLIPMAVVALVVFCAIFADYITVHSATEPALMDRLKAPFWQEGGSLTYPLGTDALGRDLLTRMIFGARISLIVATLALLLGGFIGTSIGLISGYFRGWVDAFLMRATDCVIAFPVILFALLLAVTLGPSLQNVILAIGLVLWGRYARLIRGEVLSIRERDFIAQARIVGCSPFRIIVQHLFPNILNTLIVLLTLQVGWVIIVEASLSFLGAGIPPPTPAWGSMISDGRQYIVTAWWIAVVPGVAIVATVLSFNLLGDWLRDALDPKLRQI